MIVRIQIFKIGIKKYVYDRLQSNLRVKVENKTENELFE